MIGKDIPIKISIITAVLNQADKIGNAVESVFNQFNETMEHIIIDGGSTDGTLDVLQQYSHLKVISEPDNGIYDAWNKGIHIASGEYVTFLNSDDTWSENSIQHILPLLFKGEEIVITNAVIAKSVDKGHQNIRKTYKALSGTALLASLTNRPPAINAWFIPNIVFNKVGYFDPAFTIAADVAFCIRAIIAGVKIKPIDIQFYEYLAHSESLTLSQDRKIKYNYQYQNFLVAQKLLADTIENPLMKKAIKRWLNVICYNLVVNCIILKKDQKTLWTVLKAGTKSNIFFLITFTFYAAMYWIKKITHILNRKGKRPDNE